MAFIVICGAISVLCMVFYFWSLKQQKKEKDFKEENGSRISSLDGQYYRFCNDLTRKRAELYSHYVVVNEKYQYYYNSYSQLYFAKSLKGELVWYEYLEPQKYKVEGIQNFKIVPNKEGFLRVKESYPIDRIMFFREVGSVQYTTSVSGGGVNLAGAVVGGMVAGAAGAVIGSRQTVTSSTETHDDRKVVIKFIDGMEKVYDYKYYDYFIELIPDKEYSFVMAKSQGV